MLDFIFPHFCLGCDEEGSILCTKCQATLSVLGVFVPLKKPTALDDHVAIGLFQEDTLLGKLISTYKYNFVTDVVKIFARMIQGFLDQNKKYFDGVEWIVPVPLHKRRYAERGFNQAEEIGQILGAALSIPQHNILIRKVATKQQAKLQKKEREQNVKEAFILKEGIDVQNKNIILVDDVFTTGSTLGECARVLKAAGAKSVKAFTLARG